MSANLCENIWRHVSEDSRFRLHNQRRHFGFSVPLSVFPSLQITEQRANPAWACAQHIVLYRLVLATFRAWRYESLSVSTKQLNSLTSAAWSSSKEFFCPNKTTCMISFTMSPPLNFPTSSVTFLLSNLRSCFKSVTSVSQVNKHWLSERLWQWLIHYTSIILDT
jgi:hypothetical protein